MASWIVALEELRRKAFDEDLLITVRHPVGPTIHELTTKLLEKDLSPELDKELREFLCFVEEIQELCQLELNLLEEKEEITKTLETMEESPEKQELSRRLYHLEYRLYRLEKDRTEHQKECRRMRNDPPF